MIHKSKCIIRNSCFWKLTHNNIFMYKLSKYLEEGARHMLHVHCTTQNVSTEGTKV